VAREDGFIEVHGFRAGLCIEFLAKDAFTFAELMYSTGAVILTCLAPHHAPISPFIVRIDSQDAQVESLCFLR